MNTQTVFGLVCGMYWLLGMHFFMHNRGGAGLYLPFNAWGWVFGSLAIGLGLWQIAKRQRLVFSSMQAWLWAGGLLLLLPMAYPGFEFKANALPRLLGLFAGLLFLLGLYQWKLDRQDRDKLLHLLLGAVAIEALLGLVQFYLLTPGNWIGYDVQANRPYGIFQQPNVMASFMATGLALACWLELRSDDRGGWLKVLRYGVILAASLLLTVLQSRVGQLGGVLVLLLFAPQLLQRRHWVIVALVAVGVATGLLFKPEGHRAVQRGFEMYQSIGVRTLFWSHALDLMAQAPWSGWGYGGFESTFLTQYAAKVALDPGLPSLGENITHPHNEFLYWGVEGGLAALLGLLLMVGALVGRLSRAGGVKAMGLLALLTPILLHTQTEFPFYHAVALWWALLLLIHVMDAEVEEDVQARGGRTWRESVHEPRWLMRLSALLIPLAVLPYMLSGLHTAWLVTKFEREGRIQADLLQDIVNPLPWLDRIQTIAHTLRLQEGLFTRNPDPLEAYLGWAQTQVRETPRVRLYANMALALQALDRTDEARHIQAQGLRLYPGHPSLTKVMEQSLPLNP